jgi:hypothetical protein
MKKNCKPTLWSFIIDYIKNQKEHHKMVSFEEEYRKFLIENGIDIDERYFLKD